MKQAIFILGMHRSGTSAVTRVVNLLGAELGQSLMQAADDNPRGFWEHEGAVQIHEALLTQLGHGWEDGTALPEGWQTLPEARDAAEKIAKLIDDEFADTALWAIKDPRLSLLFPLWVPLLNARDITPHCVVAWRNPMEVAASLQKRDQLQREEALLCWLAYTLESTRHAVSFSHGLLRYDDLLENWQETMQRVAEDLKIEWPNSIESVAEEVNGFLTADLRHHKSKLPESTGYVFDRVKRVVHHLEQGDVKALLSMVEEWREYSRSFAPSLRRVRLANFALLQERQENEKAIAKLQHRLEDVESQFEQLKATHEAEIPALIQQRDALQQAHDVLQARLSRILASTSWKLTRPLRQARAMIQGNKGEED